MTALSAHNTPTSVESTVYKQLSSMFSELSRYVARKQTDLQQTASSQGDAREVRRQITAHATDLSRWLFQNVQVADHVAVQMDIAGAEFEVMEQLIADGSILLIDDMDIVWHAELQPGLAEWPEMLEQMASKLGIQLRAKQIMRQP